MFRIISIKVLTSPLPAPVNARAKSIMEILADSNIRLVMFLSLSMVETRLRYDSGGSKSKHHIVVGQRPAVSVLKNVGRNLNSRFESVRRLSAN